MKVDAFLKVFDADHSGELDFAEFVKVPENTFPSKKNNLNEMCNCEGSGDVHNEEC